MNDFSDCHYHFSGHLATDADGRLFDQRFREMVAGGGDLPPIGVRLEAIEAARALRSAARALQLLKERWAERHGLSEGRLQTLMLLRRAPAGQLALGELAVELETTARNVTGLVDLLERDGLVERVPDGHDRRSVFARLTAEGSARVEALWAEVRSGTSMKSFADFTDTELAQLRHLCLRLVRSLSPAPVGSGV